jgi:hypothetical protein
MQILQRAISALSVWLAAYRGIERARARKRILGAVERKLALFTDEMSDKTRLTFGIEKEECNGKRERQIE